jgi:hypothetical protein
VFVGPAIELGAIISEDCVDRDMELLIEGQHPAVRISQAVSGTLEV